MSGAEFIPAVVSGIVMVKIHKSLVGYMTELRQNLGHSINCRSVCKVLIPVMTWNWLVAGLVCNCNCPSIFVFFYIILLIYVSLYKVQRCITCTIKYQRSRPTRLRLNTST
jgi:hypothetical protein